MRLVILYPTIPEGATLEDQDSLRVRLAWRLLRPLRVGEMACLLAGCFFLFAHVFTDSVANLAAPVWLWLAGACLDIVRKRLIKVVARDVELLNASLVVLGIIGTALYYLLR